MAWSQDLRDAQLDIFQNAGGGKPPPASSLSYIKGHRDRLRRRFQDGGAAAMPDYELLELLLFHVMRQGDVKPLARALLDRFGDFNRVLSASTSDIADVKGAGPAVALELKIVEAAAQRLARARVLQKPVLSSWDALLSYCHTNLAHRTSEALHILYLDRKNVLIAEEMLSEGTVGQVAITPRRVLKRALEADASAFILVHNHPSGDPTPSEADIAMTKQIAEAAASIDLVLHDHLIIGKSREFSFASEGYL